MTARRLLTLAVVLAALAGGVAIYASRAGEPVARPPARLEKRGWDDADLWPVNKSWVWTVDPVGTKRKTSVCVRTTRQPIPPGEEPSIEPELPLPTTGEDRRPGWARTEGRPVPARITCQLIDVRELGLGGVKEAQPLRLLVRFRTGGMSGLTGPNAVLPGDSWLHLKEHDLRWDGDVLRLLTIYTRTTDTLFTHHVFVEQTDAE
jgi:hypothetical protein